MFDRKFKFRAVRKPWDDYVSFYLGEQQGDGRFAMAERVTLKTQENKGEITFPFLELLDSDVQNIVDELYSIGFRPSKSIDSAGALEATVKHLEDMRTLVFKND
jgi:hypothetical protein